MSEITLRKAQPEDLDFIYESYKKATQEQEIAHRFHHSKESLFKALFEDCLADVLMAEQGQHSIGFAFYSLTHKNFTLFIKPGLYIHTLYVDPAYRRQKVATKLMTEIRKIAQEQNCSRIDLVVFKRNVHALKLLTSTFGAKEVDNINYMRIDMA